MDAPLGRATHPSVLEPIEAELRQGEAVVVYAEGLLRVVSPLFDKCAAVLTGERLIVLTQAWPWGFKVRAAESRADCGVVKYKMKFDGSRLMVLEHGEEVRCLYFSRHWQEEADVIKSELAHGAEEFHANVEALRELGSLSGQVLAQPQGRGDEEGPT